MLLTTILCTLGLQYKMAGVVATGLILAYKMAGVVATGLILANSFSEFFSSFLSTLKRSFHSFSKLIT